MKLKVLEKESKGAYLLMKLEKANFKAGQYVILDKRFYFSIASAEDENYLLLAIKDREGKYKELFKNKEEFEAEIKGSDLKERLKEKIVVYIVMGSGISVARSLILTLKDNKEHILLYQERNKEDLIFIDDLSKFAEIKTFLSSKREYIQNYLDNYLKKNANYVIVGSKEFNKEIKEILTKKGIKEENILFAY